MGFDLGHTISSLSKIALRTKRRLENNSNNFETMRGEFNNLTKKHQGYTQNEKVKIGLNGRTIYIYDNEEKELERFQDTT